MIKRSSGLAASIWTPTMTLPPSASASSPRPFLPLPMARSLKYLLFGLNVWPGVCGSTPADGGAAPHHHRPDIGSVPSHRRRKGRGSAGLRPSTFLGWAQSQYRDAWHAGNSNSEGALPRCSEPTAVPDDGDGRVDVEGVPADAWARPNQL